MSAGGYAWIGLTLYVLAYDGLAYKRRLPTLSSSFFDLTMRHPRWRVGLALLWVYLISHLFRLVPVRFDLLRYFDRRSPVEGK